MSHTFYAMHSVGPCFSCAGTQTKRCAAKLQRDLGDAAFEHHLRVKAGWLPNDPDMFGWWDPSETVWWWMPSSLGPESSSRRGWSTPCEHSDSRWKMQLWYKWCGPPAISSSAFLSRTVRSQCSGLTAPSSCHCKVSAYHDFHAVSVESAGKLKWGRGASGSTGNHTGNIGNIDPLKQIETMSRLFTKINMRSVRFTLTISLVKSEKTVIILLSCLYQTCQAKQSIEYL